MNTQKIQRIIEITDFEKLAGLQNKWLNKSKQLENAFYSTQGNSQSINNNHNYNEPISKHKEIKSQTLTYQQHENYQLDTSISNHFDKLFYNFKHSVILQLNRSIRQSEVQRQEITKSEIQKYIHSYESKHKQLLNTKQQLIRISALAQRKTLQNEALSSYICQLKRQISSLKYLSKPFLALQRNKIESKYEKVQENLAKNFRKKKTKHIMFNKWKQSIEEKKLEGQKQKIEMLVERQTSNIVVKFTKEISLLKQKLQQAKNKCQLYEQQKFVLHHNLKTAFLRGVTSMNMQAINIFNPQSKEQGQSKIKNQQDHQSQALSQLKSALSLQSIQTNRQKNTLRSSRSEQSLLKISKEYCVSKDHKWKQAPIFGLQKNQKYRQKVKTERMANPTTNRYQQSTININSLKKLPPIPPKHSPTIINKK